MKHKLKAFTLALLSIFFVFGGKVSAETVNIVSDTAYAPFEFKDSDQTYKGIDVDIVNEVAKRAGWNVNMTYPGFDAAVNAVQSGQADALMAGTTVTEARKKVFNFSDTYYDTSVILYTKNNNKVT
ncbi:transporter substrate-binding domain-containing protein, partial [Streptococcus agalactiae]|nr:transporter substrate-binding domain-containing protein [Streptococcus agalactiae]